MIHEAVSPADLLQKDPSMVAQTAYSMGEEVFLAFYHAVAPSLQGYIRKSCRDAVLAEDILQEAFYRFLRANVPRMDPPQMKSYLFKIATSLMIDHWRREKRERFWKDFWHSGEEQPAVEREDVSQALSRLKPKERALLWLAYVEGFNHSEIASTLGLKEKGIRVLLFRARRKLARVMGRRAGNLGVIV